MGRPKRPVPGGWIYHVLDRANARMPIFAKDEGHFLTVCRDAERNAQRANLVKRAEE